MAKTQLERKRAVEGAEFLEGLGIRAFHPVPHMCHPSPSAVSLHSFGISGSLQQAINSWRLFSIFSIIYTLLVGWCIQQLIKILACQLWTDILPAYFGLENQLTKILHDVQVKYFHPYHTTSASIPHVQWDIFVSRNIPSLSKIFHSFHPGGEHAWEDKDAEREQSLDFRHVFRPQFRKYSI